MLENILGTSAVIIGGMLLVFHNLLAQFITKQHQRVDTKQAGARDSRALMVAIMSAGAALLLVGVLFLFGLIQLKG